MFILSEDNLDSKHNCEPPGFESIRFNIYLNCVGYKATLDAVNREKKILEKSVEKLQKENSELQKEAGKNSELQVTIL